MPCRTVSSTVPVTPEPIDAAQVVAGDPRSGFTALHDDALWSVGIWEHTAGTSTDVEVDEVFVVLAGRATIAIEGEGTLSVGPGDIGILEAGARTTWTVHEPLRKIYITLGTGTDEESGA